MLHGWGMHSAIWDDFALALARRYRVTTVDLPGHGRSAAMSAVYDLEQLSAGVLASVPTPAHFLGWSLGGLVAQDIAFNSPAAVSSLVLIASTPQFAQSRDWPNATRVETLEQFARALGEDYRDTLNRFLALEVQGSEMARTELRALRQLAFAHGEPQLAALVSGLNILRSTNLRPQFHSSNVDRLVLLGQRDALVPAGVANDLVTLYPQSRIHIVNGAAHAPFLTRQEECVEIVGGFLR